MNFKVGDIVDRRDGVLKGLRVICIDCPGDFPVVAVSNVGGVFKYMADGHYSSSPSVYDIIPTPVRYSLKRYIVVSLCSKDGSIKCSSYINEESANADTKMFEKCGYKCVVHPITIEGAFPNA